MALGGPPRSHENGAAAEAIFTLARGRCVLTSCPCSPLNNKQYIAPGRPPRAFPQGHLASLPKGRAIVIGASVFDRRSPWTSRTEEGKWPKQQGEALAG